MATGKNGDQDAFKDVLTPTKIAILDGDRWKGFTLLATICHRGLLRSIQAQNQRSCASRANGKGGGGKTLPLIEPTGRQMINPVNTTLA